MLKIKGSTVEQLRKRLKYLTATGRENRPEAMHIKGELRRRSL